MDMQIILWGGAALCLVLYLARRRKRKLMD
jgi:LPXTG-motif cell wall-anchored protein